jgi:hypothetical protein
MACRPAFAVSGYGPLPLKAFDSPAVRAYAIIHAVIHQPLLQFGAHRDESAAKTGESRRPARPGVRSNLSAYSGIHPSPAVADERMKATHRAIEPCPCFLSSASVPAGGERPVFGAEIGRGGHAGNRRRRDRTTKSALGTDKSQAATRNRIRDFGGSRHRSGPQLESPRFLC